MPSQFLLIEVFDQGVSINSLPERPNALEGEKLLAVLVQEAAIPLVHSLLRSNVIESTVWEGKIKGAMKEQIKQTKRAKTRTTDVALDEALARVKEVEEVNHELTEDNHTLERQLEAQTFAYQSYLKLNEEINKVQLYILNVFSGDLAVDTLPKDQDHSARVVSILRIQEQRISDLKSDRDLEMQRRADADTWRAKAEAKASLITNRNWLARLLNVGVAALLLVAVGSAQTPPSPAPPSPATSNKVEAPAYVVPVISGDLRAKFWRAQADNVTAQANAEKARETLNTAVTALRDACGTKANLAVDGQGEPTCNKIPDPPKPASTPAKPEVKKEEKK